MMKIKKRNASLTKKPFNWAQISALVVGAAGSVISWILPVDFPIGEEIWLPLVTLGIGLLFNKMNQRSAVADEDVPQA